MTSRSRISALLLIMVTALTTPAVGGVIIDSGNLHAQASARYTNLLGQTFTSNSNPPDQSWSPPSSTIGASANAGGGMSASVSATVGRPFMAIPPNAYLFLNATGSISGRDRFSTDDSSASASGTLNFTVTASETFVMQGSGSPFFSGSVTLKDAADTTLENFFMGTFGSSPRSVTLTPGQYKIDWQVAPHRETSVGGSGQAFWQLIPEPSAAMAALMFVPLLGRGNRRAGMPV